MQIALIASARFAIRQPFAGGLEAHTWALARGLRKRGHKVTVFAGAGCDPLLGVTQIAMRRPRISSAARRDVSMTSQEWMDDHHGYLQLMLALADGSAGTFDVVHNNCLHHLPVAMARMLPAPMLTTLHTPPTPWLESAIQVGDCPATFAAVSHHTARAWAHQIPAARVVRNGVDATVWRPGPGGGNAVWSGRLVPEKGADLAIAAARKAGIPLDIVGPVSDPAFFGEHIEPALGNDVRYLGHLDHAALAKVMGRAAVCLVTPRWDEPYGLVVAEALACGTPVCGFARGALPELVNEDVAILVAPDDVAALAAALPAARLLSRSRARKHAVEHCSHEAMIDGYERLYAELAT